MAKLFDTEKRIVPTWLAAARHLMLCGRTDSNLVLEISDPNTITAEDRVLMRSLDAAVEPRGLYPLNSVAGTIFPLDVYRRHGRPAFYDEFNRMMERGKAKGTWGTYAQRMIVRRDRKSADVLNPLELIVQRISNAGQPAGASFKNSYELGVAVPEEDLTDFAEDVGGELPTYAPDIDQNQWYGFPCLSHLSFKRVPSGEHFAVNLTAVYRSHRYCERALGNLLGLAQLQWFVAKEARLQVGTLTCLSTHAELDVAAWGGVDAARKLLEQPAQNMVACAGSVSLSSAP